MERRTDGREVHGLSPTPRGCTIAPPARSDAGWGDRRFRVSARLFDNRWEISDGRFQIEDWVSRRGAEPPVPPPNLQYRLRMAGGRSAFSHEITRLPGGGVGRSPGHSGIEDLRFQIEDCEDTFEEA